MAEDNQDQAREMAEEGVRKLRRGEVAEGCELVEEADRLDHDAVATILPARDPRCSAKPAAKRSS